MTLEQLKELARHSLNGTAPENYSVNSVNEAIRNEFKEMCKSINSFMRYRYDIYDIIIEAADEYVPNKVMQAFAPFAEVKQVAQGEKAMFRRVLGKQRAKQFLTQVGLSGVYETFRLDNETYEVSTTAIGGAASVDFERMLDNAEILSDYMEIMLEGLTEAMYGQIQRALISATSVLKTNNYHISNGFSAEEMVKLMNVVRAYSNGGVVIFAPPEFVAGMGADAIVPVLTNNGTNVAPGVYHPQDIDAIHNTGFITMFRGAPIVQFPQSYLDENNEETVVNPQYAYIFPAGREKVIKLVFEGDTQMWDR